MRKDQKGFTLVELLIAVAIMSVVLAAVCGFIIVGSKSYAAANSDINVQQEAQLALNQMSDVMIDTTRSVNYAGYDSIGSPTLVVKDSEFTFEPTGKSLTLYNGTSVKQADGSSLVEEGNGNKNYQFYWDKADEVLWYTEQAVTQDTFPALGDPAWEVLADHVTDFSIDLTQVEEKRVVQIAMTIEYGGREYTTSNNVTIRNKVGINEAEIKSLDRSKTLSVATKDNGIIIEPGETFHFSVPIVTGTNVTDKSVTWSMDPAYSGSSGFVDSDNGILHIANNEPAGTIKVVITTNAVDSEGRHASVDVPVNIKKVREIALTKTEDSNAGDGPLQISPGSTFTISANVDGNKLGSTCSVCGDDTTIDKQAGHEGTAYPWLIVNPSEFPDDTTGWNPRKYIKMIESAPDHATFIFGPDENGNMPTSDDLTKYTVVIQAASLLSVTDNSHGRHYDPVFGAIELTMVQGKKQDLTLDGNLKYGDEPLTLNWDYEHAHSLVIVRIKTDDPNTPMESDRVIAFSSDGKAIRIGADLFGLDLDHVHYLSIQVLDYPLSKGSADYEQRLAYIRNEYESHLDSSGTYTGQIPSSSKLTTPIYPPQITFSYDGNDYTAQKIDMGEFYIAQGAVSKDCNATAISSTRSEGERVLNDVKCDVYKGDGDSISGWSKLYWYDTGSNNYTGTSQIGGLGFQNCSVHSGKQLRLYLDQNNRSTNELGTYHFVPFFSYSNLADSQRYVVHWKNYEPDYNLHYYYRPESAITFTVKRGNMVIKNLWDGDRNSYYNGESFFTYPSQPASDWDTDKFKNYFELGKTEWHSWKRPSWAGDGSLTVYKDNGEQKNITVTDVQCHYIAKEDAYEIEIFYVGGYSWNGELGKSMKDIYSAGKFKCKANGTKWEQTSVGGHVKSEVMPW